MSNPSDRKPRPAPKDPAAALNALDLSLASQEMESEIRDVLREFLPLLDGVERLCRHLDCQPPAAVAEKAEALALLAEIAAAAAQRIGLERTAGVGDRVDPARHEVVEAVPDTACPPGTILEILENGWTYDGKPLRRAQVVTSTTHTT